MSQKLMKPTLSYSHPDILYQDNQKEIVRATSEHAAYLQHHMRDEDKFECSLYDMSPWNALHSPLRWQEAETWTGVYKGTPVCMFGVCPNEENEELIDIFGSQVDIGSIWLLGSTHVDTVYRPFLRLSRLAADHLCRQYDVVENVVPLQNSKTIMWLTWLGFNFFPQTIKVKDTECVRFVRCLSHLDVTLD